ncbi:MAG: family 16 glycoside hydrolase, partial [Planctomycetota bacterium]
SVRDGCIVGSTEPGKPDHNTHLIWKGGELRDFELSFAVRLDGDNNSGVQYRSRRLGDAGYAVAGPQCDVHAAKGYFGMLYDEGGRGLTAVMGQRIAFAQDGTKRVVQDDGSARAVDLTSWHTVKIVARGTTMQHFVDGALAVEVVDESALCARSGILALQVHSGPRSSVWFKDLVLTRLPREEIAATSAPAVEAVPQWIWDAEAAGDEEVFFRRAFVALKQPASAMLHVTADNHCRVYVNGERVAQNSTWELPRRVDVQKWLKAGDNVIAVHAWNDGGPAGLVAQLRFRDGEQVVSIGTDASWRTSDDDPDGWNKAGFDDASWTSAHLVAELGAGPWSGSLGSDAFAPDLDADRPQPPQPTDELTAPLGWTKERLFSVPRALGSFVCMCLDDQGRLYASDQNRGLYRITPAGVKGRADTIVERIEIDLEGCQGLCFAFGALYAVQSQGKTGLYRVTDRDGDDRLDHVELLRSFRGDGEHGPHAVELAPDGEHLLVLCGNHVLPPELQGSRVPRPFVEDVLIPGIDDPNGHAVGITAPGGYVCQVDRDGTNWELYCCGFRNAYDLAVLPNGDVVTFDADMEWDMGLPWYRPTRILQVLSGVDYGWRTGSRKWGADVPDSLPSVCDIGPASPTGMAAFAAGALALDWTFGTAYGVEFTADAGMLHGRAVSFASGTPLPLTDVLVDRERGRVYLLTGGRGLPSKLYRLTPSSGSIELTALPTSAARAKRLELEVFSFFHVHSN